MMKKRRSNPNKYHRSETHDEENISVESPVGQDATQTGYVEVILYITEK